MLKNLIFVSLFCAIFSLSAFSVSGQQPPAKEIELANLIVKADTSLDLNNSQTAADYLSQAEQIILQNPGINNNLQGHFNKVRGKFYMKSSFNQALGHFNAALSYFSGNGAEQARVNLFIGITYYYANDLNTAQVYFNTAKEYFIQSNDRANLAQALNNLGVVAFKQSDEARAVDFCQQALSINDDIDADRNAARNQYNLDYFSSSVSSGIEEYYNNNLGGGGGTSGSGTTITTGGSGTVVASGNGGN